MPTIVNLIDKLNTVYVKLRMIVESEIAGEYKAADALDWVEICA